METIRALIIDDEKPARDLIRAFLRSFPQIEVAGECANGFEALKMVSSHSPHLLFLDIRMPKISGLEFLELLEDPPVTIFSTAYDDQAVKAFEMDAVDYLLKPYSEERFKQAVEKALEKIKSGSANPLSEKTKGVIDPGNPGRIVVRTGNSIQVLKFEQISHFIANDDYVDIFTKEGRFTKKMTMKYLEGFLPGDLFCRVHRSVIVKLEAVGKIEPYSKDSYTGTTINGGAFPVSKAGYKKLKELLGI